MAQQILNIGTNANDGTGDNLRTAMIKVNENFTEVFAAPGVSETLLFVGNEISAARSNDDIVFKPAGTGAVSFPALRIDDNNIVGTRSNDDINLLPSGTGSVIFGSIKIKGTSFFRSLERQVATHSWLLHLALPQAFLLVSLQNLAKQFRIPLPVCVTLYILNKPFLTLFLFRGLKILHFIVVSNRLL